MPALFKASAITLAAIVAAMVSLSVPPKAPIAVRHAPATTTSFIFAPPRADSLKTVSRFSAFHPHENYDRFILRGLLHFCQIKTKTIRFQRILDFLCVVKLLFNSIFELNSILKIGSLFIRATRPLEEKWILP
jgi:hypothetical protein